MDPGLILGTWASPASIVSGRHVACSGLEAWSLVLFLAGRESEENRWVLLINHSGFAGHRQRITECLVTGRRRKQRHSESTDMTSTSSMRIAPAAAAKGKTQSVAQQIAELQRRVKELEDLPLDKQVPAD